MAFYAPPGVKPPTTPAVFDPEESLKKLQSDYLAKLEKVTGLSKDKAKEEMLGELQKAFADEVAKEIVIARVRGIKVRQGQLLNLILGRNYRRRHGADIRWSKRIFQQQPVEQLKQETVRRV